MQIRIRDGKVQLIRTKYDPTIKRGRAVLLGTMSIHDSEIPSFISAKLTESERAQLQPMLDENKVKSETSNQSYSAQYLPRTIRYATKWYLTGDKGKFDLAAIAEESRAEFTKLLAAMVKAGVGRKRKR